MLNLYLLLVQLRRKLRHNLVHSTSQKREAGPA
uniref:Uncharacterized protein n=1 Tax=Podoviridae sp. ctsUe5 TaxID=2827750 RepID=A0A8S5S652_9CAUD|nr:MAG TPA: hypothetical protein [Podoviridae sp. ctsUe5]